MDAFDVKDMPAARAEGAAAAALARLATRPDLVEVLLRPEGSVVAAPDAAALVRRKLMYEHKSQVRLTVYYLTNLGHIVARLAREKRAAGLSPMGAWR